MIKVSALVSVYKAREFIEQCLADLTAQSLFAKGQLEIVVIDSASPEDEREVIERYQKSSPNIVYHRTAEREPLYQSWNRGLEIATGSYITNANCDDRHHPECLEALCKVLDNRPEIDLVYADVYESTVANQAFKDNPKTSRYSFVKYFAPDALLFYQFGCQPLWRKGVHDRMGLFSNELRAAGDWDFSIRFALAGLRALHLPQVLGSFLHREVSLSHQDSASVREQALMKQRYLNIDSILALYRVEGWKIESAEDRARIFTDFGMRASNLSLPWQPGKSFVEPSALVIGCQAAYEAAQNNARASWNLGVAMVTCGLGDRATPLLQQALGTGDAGVREAWTMAQNQSVGFRLLPLW